MEEYVGVDLVMEVNMDVNLNVEVLVYCVERFKIFKI